MAGISGSASGLAEVLVRIEVGHVVSSSSMVSRAYLVDNCVGVVVDAGEPGYWLASALSVLAPDPDGLRVRAAEKGGIPVEHGTPRLAKVTLRWGESSVELNNPTVRDGGGVGVVSLAVPASFVDVMMDGGGPKPVSLSSAVAPVFGDWVAVPVATDGGAAVRWARVASDAGFGGCDGAVALDVGLAARQTGSPAFILGETEVRFCGLVQPIDGATSTLLPPRVVLAALP